MKNTFISICIASLALCLPQQLLAQKNENANHEDSYYLKGAVPEVNGKVVFTKHINAPGKSAAQIYDILHQYLQKMVKEKNQLENSKLITEDTQKHELVASFEE